VQETWESPWESVGTTPARQELTIPPCVCWGVKPLPAWDRDWAALVRVMNQEHVPGLVMTAATLDADADLAGLKQLQGLEELNLGGTAVTDAGLAYLKGLARLEGLSLAATRLTGAGLAQLKQLQRLQRLNLGGTAVTDAGL